MYSMQSRSHCKMHSLRNTLYKKQSIFSANSVHTKNIYSKTKCMKCIHANSIHSTQTKNLFFSKSFNTSEAP